MQVFLPCGRPRNADTEEIVNETALEGDAPVGVTNTPAVPQNSNTETPAPAPESTGNRRNNSGGNRNTGAAPATDAWNKRFILIACLNKVQAAFEIHSKAACTFLYQLIKN
ncbi:hypothetical protein, partial [Kingella kingae]|uniref:hypothetical protein n=1 Tax=Kingella kingae TaxID=504 RepID=UPI001E650C2A